MILEFVLENFRSVNQEQVLSFYTTGSQGGTLGNTSILPGTPYRVLKSIGLYGANASGKTNILRALWTLRRFVVSSYRAREGDRIGWYEPCAFHSAEEDDSTKFEIDLTIPIDGGSYRFVYTLGYNQSEVTREELIAYPKGRPAVLFTRKKGDTRDTIAFGTTLKGGDRKIAFFRNQSYLSVAGNNAAAPAVLRQVYQYFRNNFVQIRLYEEPGNAVGDRSIEASKLVRFVDVGVTDIERHEVEADLSGIQISPDVPDEIRQSILNNMRSRFVFKHEGAHHRLAEIDLSDESDGTQRLFRLFPRLIDVLVRGGVFIIDEIECGMHPFMAETLIRLFNDVEVNRGQAQLIFTTHNSNLMSQDLLRRDQIWFTEKTEGITRCYSLEDFDKKVVTPTSPYVKWYLEGRFGAVPAIRYADLVRAVLQFQKGHRDAQ